jgi:hypothetical protein
VAGDADNFARVRRLAMIALQTARDEHLPTLTAASQDADWQVRRLVALRVDPARPELDGIGAMLARDQAFQVRYEMLTSMARRAMDSHDCAAVLAAVDDPAPTVVLRALDVLPAGCREHDAIVKKVDALAAGLKSAGATSWHVPARALTALGRLSPKQATAQMPSAIAHAAWQVRATAAGVAATLGDTSALDLLARDRHPNVQTAVLDGLRRMKAGYRALMDTSLLALEGTDHQLLRTAATTMPDPGVADRDRAAKALLGALQRLTAIAADTSRDPRTAIVQKLATVLQADSAGGLFAYMGDYDPRGGQRRAREADRQSADGGPEAAAPLSAAAVEPGHVAGNRAHHDGRWRDDRSRAARERRAGDDRALCRAGARRLLQRADVPPHRAQLRRPGRQPRRQRIRGRRAVHARRDRRASRPRRRRHLHARARHRRHADLHRPRRRAAP